MLKPITVEFQDNFITFKYEGSDNIVFKTQKNLFEKETGLTIRNPDVNIPAYIIELSQYGSKIECGHIIDNIVGALQNLELENILLIIDFSNVTDISDSFSEQFIKFILSTKNKVLYININTNISNALSAYIESIIDIQDL